MHLHMSNIGFQDPQKFLHVNVSFDSEEHLVWENTQFIILSENFSGLHCSRLIPQSPIPSQSLSASVPNDPQRRVQALSNLCHPLSDSTPMCKHINSSNCILQSLACFLVCRIKTIVDARTNHHKNRRRNCLRIVELVRRQIQSYRRTRGTQD